MEIELKLAIFANFALGDLYLDFGSGSYVIPACIIHRPLSVYRILLRLETLFWGWMDRRTYRQMGIETSFITATLGGVDRRTSELITYSVCLEYWIRDGVVTTNTQQLASCRQKLSVLSVDIVDSFSYIIHRQIHIASIGNQQCLIR